MHENAPSTQVRIHRALYLETQTNEIIEFHLWKVIPVRHAHLHSMLRYNDVTGIAKDYHMPVNFCVQNGGVRPSASSHWYMLDIDTNGLSPHHLRTQPSDPDPFTVGQRIYRSTPVAVAFQECRPLVNRVKGVE